MTQEVIAPLDPGSRGDETLEPVGCDGNCACGETSAAGLPELDARAIPHALRHAAIFGALDDLAPGDGLILVAPHDPPALLVQLQQRSPDTFDIEYLQSGPGVWRLSLIRKDA